MLTYWFDFDLQEAFGANRAFCPDGGASKSKPVSQLAVHGYFWVHTKTLAAFVEHLLDTSNTWSSGTDKWPSETHLRCPNGPPTTSQGLSKPSLPEANFIWPAVASNYEIMYEGPNETKNCLGAGSHMKWASKTLSNPNKVKKTLRIMKFLETRLSDPLPTNSDELRSFRWVFL